MAKYGRQTPGRKAYKAPFKTYTIDAHRSAYRVYKGYLWFYPIYENGSIDYSRGEIVKESPKVFKTGHQLAMIQLGVGDAKRREKVIKRITYY